MFSLFKTASDFLFKVHLGFSGAEIPKTYCFIIVYFFNGNGLKSTDSTYEINVPISNRRRTISLPDSKAVSHTDLVLNSKPMDEILKYDHSNESFRAVLSSGSGFISIMFQMKFDIFRDVPGELKDLRQTLNIGVP